jgi:hypothetical protein
MKVEIDQAQVRDYMTLWREALDMKIPLKDEFKIHFMSRRQSILENYLATATAWGMLLGTTTATGEDKLELSGLKQDVSNFKQWAKEEIDKLAAL